MFVSSGFGFFFFSYEYVLLLGNYVTRTHRKDVDQIPIHCNHQQWFSLCYQVFLHIYCRKPSFTDSNASIVKSISFPIAATYPSNKDQFLSADYCWHHKWVDYMTCQFSSGKNLKCKQLKIFPPQKYWQNLNSVKLDFSLNPTFLNLYHQIVWLNVAIVLYQNPKTSFLRNIFLLLIKK